MIMLTIPSGRSMKSSGSSSSWQRFHWSHWSLNKWWCFFGSNDANNIMSFNQSSGLIIILLDILHWGTLVVLLYMQDIPPLDGWCHSATYSFWWLLGSQWIPLFSPQHPCKPARVLVLWVKRLQVCGVVLGRGFKHPPTTTPHLSTNHSPTIQALPGTLSASVPFWAKSSGSCPSSSSSSGELFTTTLSGSM